MASLSFMPPIIIDQNQLAEFGQVWRQNGGKLSRTPPYSSINLGDVFDTAIGQSLATLLGGIAIIAPKASALIPALPDCVEVGEVRIVGGVRPQNFDVGYRPDGVRFAHDTKTLNDEDSIGKNWQNMVNDLATEATTVHSRFPYALVTFILVCPLPALSERNKQAIIETLERLARRESTEGLLHLAEVISMVAWNPDDGTISTDVPNPDSPLRIEKFSEQVEVIYYSRYKGLPPHTE
jgi:hypothetical protein